MSTAVATTPTLDPATLARRQKINEEAEKLDTIVSNAMGDIAAAKGELTRSLAIARAYLDIKAELTNQLKFVVALAKQANGFKCDKDYDEATIKQCAVDALIAGFSLTGNEFNIIGGNMYGAQNGWKSKLRKLPGFSFMDVPQFEAPIVGQGFVEVKCKQAYRYNGSEGIFEFKAFVKTNAGSNIDNNIGKAKAKLWHALFEKLTGESWAQAGELDGNGNARPGIDAPKTQLSMKAIQDAAETLRAADVLEKPRKDADIPELIDHLDHLGGLESFLDQCGITEADLRATTGKTRVDYRASLLEEIRIVTEGK